VAPTTRKSVLVGRQRELELLAAALTEAEGGRGGLVLLSGEPGIGKTRLVEELARLARERQASVVWGRCWEGEGAPDLWPWQQVVRSCLRAVDGAALRDLVGPHGSELTALVAPTALAEAGESNSAGARFRTFNAIAHLLDAYSGRAPAVVVLEDLHRADSASLLLLQFFTQEQRQRSLLVVGTYRELGAATNRALTQMLVEASREPGTQRQALGSLSVGECGELVCSQLGVDLDGPCLEVLYRRSGGNPLLLIECARSSLRRGDPAALDATWLATAPLSAELCEIVELRLSALTVAERSVLCSLACRGGAIANDALDELSSNPDGADTAAVASALASAENQGLLSRDADGFRFAHRLVAEVLRSGVASQSVAPQPPVQANARIGVFRREGEYWSISFAGRSCRLRDSKGLAHLAFLLRHPGRSLHATEIVNLGEVASGAVAGAAGVDPSVGVRSGLGDAGVHLDTQAKQAYRQRLSELRAELEEAERFHDSGRAERIRHELDFVTDELSAAVGLGGRDRRAGSDAERARVNVTRSIARALEKMADSHPELASHLSQTIRTGTFCTYAADPALGGFWDT
jgi:hypothetical protein